MSKKLYLRCPLCGKLGKLEVEPAPPGDIYEWRVHCWSCADGEPKSADGWLGALAKALGCRKPGDLLYSLDPYGSLERGTPRNGGAPVRLSKPPRGGLLSAKQVARYHDNLLGTNLAQRWLWRRGIFERTWAVAKLGYDPRAGVVVVPYPGGVYKTRKPSLLTGSKTFAMVGKGRPWPLYVPNAPRLKQRGWTFLCEGEWDALRLESLGLPAAALPLGKATWKPWRERWAPQLVRSGVDRVVVCLDVGAEADAARHAEQLRAESLRAVVLDLRTLGLETKNTDVSDYLNGHGGSRAALLDAVRALDTPESRTRPRRAGKAIRGV